MICSEVSVMNTENLVSFEAEILNKNSVCSPNIESLTLKIRCDWRLKIRIKIQTFHLTFDHLH